MGTAGRAGCSQDGGPTTDERRELAQLRRENRRLREDVEILKGPAFAWDNAPAESFFSAIKGQLLYDQAWPTLVQRHPAALRKTCST